MKSYLLIFLAFFACSRTDKEFAEVRIDRELVDLGTYAQSEIKVASFKISNVGSLPFVIEDVSMDCQCTLVDWSTLRVPPSGSTVIKVNYDNSNTGIYQKLVYIKANTAKPITLVIRGKIV
ncbi:Protein of unknown function [Dyadobacter sp. SG02]|uniref:DUF1573 domain-containing protein n=1 Tax=Dyadobacter sp. SG02 TaxID=1855291 RepID=UPI0008BE9358|nr:DUF1573 domain-containing protein [Dyadobacter sp. SG02]SEJ75836.1 Protein of unknown function [Dyadobacter sp. SG02]